MRYHRIIRTCFVAAAMALWGANVARAQVYRTTPAPVAGDTLILNLAEVQSLALTENPALLADRQETQIARGQLRQARIYNFNPELNLEAPGLGTTGGFG